MSEENKITKLGDEYEIKSFLAVSKLMNRLLDGFFHFKKRKGEIVAGATTFFGLLSFGPILLFMISVAGWIFESQAEAKAYVLTTINNAFPKLAPWILDSISNIVNQQLSGGAGFNVIGTFLLLYSCLGVVTTLIFGLNQISKTENKGGFFIDDLRSIIMGVFVATFITGLMFISNKTFMMGSLTNGQEGAWNSFAKFLITYNVLPALASLGFFTMFYKAALPKKVTWKDAMLGASSFVGCFMIGKSFYWVYHLYSKDALAQSYGNFYTMVIAVFWIYFLMCSLFYGASVATVSYKDIYRNKIHPRDLEVIKQVAAEKKQKQTQPSDQPQVPAASKAPPPPKKKEAA